MATICRPADSSALDASAEEWIRVTKPLKGVRIVELAGLAPAPFAAMMLADHGAEVIRIERAGATPPVPPDKDILRRNRAEIVALDLKDEADVARLRALAAGADG